VVDSSAIPVTFNMPLYDQLGNEVPAGSHLETAFADTNILRECILGIQNYAAVIHRLAHSKQGSALKYCDKVREALPIVAQYLDNVSVEFPYAVCEACEGIRFRGCAACNNRGYLNYHDYHLVQSEKQVGKRTEDGTPKRAKLVALKIAAVLRRHKDDDEQACD